MPRNPNTKEARLKRQRARAVEEKMSKMSPIEKVQYILSNKSSYAKFDKELSCWYMQELIKMNGGPTQFMELFPPELRRDVVNSWSIGRRSQTPFFMRMIVSYMESKGARRPENDTAKLRSVLDKTEEAYMLLQDRYNELENKYNKLKEK
jgi:hypothetical protein